MTNVFCFLDNDNQFVSRLVVRGLARYAKTRNWNVEFLFRTEVRRERHRLNDLVRHCRPDGIVAAYTEGLRDVLPSDLPVVWMDVLATSIWDSDSLVSHDSSRSAELAADELVRLKMPHYAAVGFRAGMLWAGKRIADFSSAVRRHHPQATVSVWSPARPPDEKGSFRRLVVPWLRDLPKPCGVFAVCDRVAVNVLSAAVVELAYADFPTEDMRVSAFCRLASQDDFDGDGLSDKVEEWVLGTDPASSDTDNDGLSDGEEVGLKADPTSADSDSDGIDDGDEVGYLKVADSFVWYDTSELKPTYNTGYWHEELDTGISSWWCQATSGTCPDGAVIPIASSEFACLGAYSEIRLVRTRAQLVELGLLPPQDEDGVDEMAAYDVGTLAGADGSDLSDCLAFEQMALARRGRATNERTLTLDSSPPNSELSESFFKAAGVEVLSVTYGGVRSARRQIMNQADFFYYSGHGHHRWGTVDDFDPSAVAGYWMRDLDCVIFAGCSVLDINDYNDNFLNLEGVWDPADHAASPGKLWAAVGPKVLLGYNYYAPQDSSRAPERIMRSWLDLRQTMGDVDAWMKANDNRNGHNACTIQRIDDSHIRYGYFKREKGFLYNSYFPTNVIERIPR